MNKRRIATMMMLTLMVLALMACEGATPYAAQSASVNKRGS